MKQSFFQKSGGVNVEASITKTLFYSPKLYKMKNEFRKNNKIKYKKTKALETLDYNISLIKITIEQKKQIFIIYNTLIKL